MVKRSKVIRVDRGFAQKLEDACRDATKRSGRPTSMTEATRIFAKKMKKPYKIVRG